jgi:adenosylhomocysteine nucleosidase
MTAQPFSTFRQTGAGRRSFIATVSGMGKIAAAIAATHLVLVHRVSMLVSAGLCGRLTMQNGWTVGDLFRIGTVVESDCDRFGQAEPTVVCDAPWFSELNAVRLVTQDRPVFDAARRSRLAGIGDLADMEGAAVARVASLYGIPCAMIKGISDAADENGRQDVASHIDWVSARIADALAHELSIKPTDSHET